MMGVRDAGQGMIPATTPREGWYTLLLGHGWTAPATAEDLVRGPHTIGGWLRQWRTCDFGI